MRKRKILAWDLERGDDSRNTIFSNRDGPLLTGKQQFYTAGPWTYWHSSYNAWALHTYYMDILFQCHNTPFALDNSRSHATRKAHRQSTTLISTWPLLWYRLPYLMVLGREGRNRTSGENHGSSPRKCQKLRLQCINTALSLTQNCLYKNWGGLSQQVS